MGDTFVRFKAAAVQAAPVFLDRGATVAKACSLIRGAASNGARLVAFPEVFVPGYPYWIWVETPLTARRLFVELVKNGVEVPSDATEQLCQAAREGRCYVVIGINERGRHSSAELYNTALVIGPDGRIIGKHRKLMPTYAEKLTWGFGDGSTLRPYGTEIGRLGVLNCGENGNPLLRFALIAQGEQVHVANYPALSLAPESGHFNFRLAEEIRTAAHAFEGKLFNVVSSAVMDEEAKAIVCDTEEKRRLFRNVNNVLTAIYGPDGSCIAGPLGEDDEGIVYGDVDLEAILAQKLFHDVAGSYNRFDVVSLNLNRRPLSPIREEMMVAAREAVRQAGPDVESLADELRAELRRLVQELLTNADLDKGGTP
ncbi:MAG: carbon-nitrogen hydrolase family protein [Dehalococcoidia bacterium]